MADKGALRSRRKARQRRKHRLVISLNEEEALAVENYCKRYRHTAGSKAQLIRALLLSQMIEQYEQDSPMLFTEEEMQ